MGSGVFEEAGVADAVEPIRLWPGERKLLDFLTRHLPPGWELYPQPALNGLRPDFVCLSPDHGVVVLEVKDWRLDGRYRVTPSAVVRDANGVSEFLRHPIEQIKLYRDEIASLYCPRAEERAALEGVSAVLVFPCADDEDVWQTFGESYDLRVKRRDRGLVTMVGSRTLAEDRIDRLLPLISRPLRQNLAADLRHWLVEPDFRAEQALLPKLSARQEELVSTRTASGYRRIRGSAGSGKSLVLAGRAARLQRERRDVLVVSYNVTLLRYLEGLAGRFGCQTRDVTWLNFHGWCKRVMLQTGQREAYTDLWKHGGSKDAVFDHELPRMVSEAITANPQLVDTYDAILVDEGQDFLPQWWSALRGVLRPDGEMLLVADRAQDLYGRNEAWTEGVMRGSGFPGNWNELGTSYRMPLELSLLCRTFAQEYLPETADMLPEPPLQEEFNTDRCRLSWIQADTKAPIESADALAEILGESEGVPGGLVPPADVVFLSDANAAGRDIVAELERRGVRVQHTFAANSAKRSFFADSDRVKATTIASFKGWEGRAVVLSINRARNPEDLSAVYAGLTRLKAHPNGSYLTVICSAPELERFGRLWPNFRRA